MSAAYYKVIIPAVAFAALLAVFDYAPVSYLVNNAHAETGIGKDVFKVVVSVFGANKETGDILALVTVNDNSKAKLFDLHSMSPHLSMQALLKMRMSSSSLRHFQKLL